MWKFMPFRLKNAPATFSRLVTQLLLGLEAFMGAFVDDIIIFSKTWEEHFEYIDRVLSE
jgi:hypothetical protein